MPKEGLNCRRPPKGGACVAHSGEKRVSTLPTMAVSFHCTAVPLRPQGRAEVGLCQSKGDWGDEPIAPEGPPAAPKELHPSVAP